MQRRRFAGALPLLMAIWLCGCSGQPEVYVAGVTSVRETQAKEPQADAGPGGAQTGGAAGESQTKADSDGSQTAADSEGSQTGGGAKESQAGARSGETEPMSEGYVYVCGAVARPGVYPLYAGMRVFEALELAGGFTEEADTEWLNQAETLRDGERLCVYTREETRLLREEQDVSGMNPQQEPSGPGSAGQSDGKVNLNTADREQLMTLPGIGEARADAIIQYRTERGAFASIEEIQNISGIKGAVFSKIKDQITV